MHMAHVVGVKIVQKYEHTIAAVGANKLHRPVTQHIILLVLCHKLVAKPLLVYGVYQRRPVPVIAGLDAGLVQHLEHRREIPVLVGLDGRQRVVFQRPVVVHHAVHLRTRAAHMAGVVGHRDRRHHVAGCKRSAARSYQRVDIGSPGLGEAVHADTVESEDDDPFGLDVPARHCRSAGCTQNRCCSHCCTCRQASLEEVPSIHSKAYLTNCSTASMMMCTAVMCISWMRSL